MTRVQAREEAFLIVFEYSFTGHSSEELLELAAECREFKPGTFVKDEVCGVIDNITEIDGIIEANIKGWKIGRLGKVALAVLRLAVFEIVKREDIPVGATINEAVELAKKYGGDEDSSYINGVLGTVARSLNCEADS